MAKLIASGPIQAGAQVEVDLASGVVRASRSDLTPSLRLWLGEDVDRVLLVATHWEGVAFTGRHFYLD